MTLREGAASHVLTGEPHIFAFGQQRAERQGFGCRPIDAFTGRNGGLLGFKLTGDLRIDVEVRRNVGDGFAHFAQGGQRHAGGFFAEFFFFGQLGQTLPFAFKPIGLIGLIAFGRLELAFQQRLEIGVDLVRLFLGQRAFLDQTLGIQRARGRTFGDFLVHLRLGKRRFVRFIMAVTAIAGQIDDHIGGEFLTEIGA